jgi:hypothetical protein
MYIAGILKFTQFHWLMSTFDQSYEKGEAHYEHFSKCHTFLLLLMAELEKNIKEL